MYRNLVASIVPERIVGASDEITLDCSDPNCPNPKNHLYFNVEKGIGFCHRCQSVTTIQALIRYYTGVSWNEADNIVKGRGVHKVKNLKRRFETLKTSKELNTSPSEIVLPPEFIPFSSGSYTFPYLDKRGISYEIAQNLGMGFCPEGKWKNRLIIPVYQDLELKGFLGRSIFDPPSSFSAIGQKVWARFNNYKKILNPKGFSASRLIYNYDKIEEKIIITEGVFDAIRVYPYGVALFGKHMSKQQQALILRKRPKKVYVMLDSDAVQDAQKISSMLASMGLNVYCVELPYGDPGSLPKDQIAFYLKKAIQVSPLKLFSIRKKTIF